MGSVSEATVVVAARDALTAEFSPELVILNLQDGVYYGLEDVGARVWGLLQAPVSIGAIRDAIVTEYDVGADQCGRDLMSLVTDLLERGLVTLC